MISYIRGTLAFFEEDKVIVDVGGVGYGIYMSGQYYLPVLLVAGMITGFVIGLVSNEMLKRLVNIQM